MPHGSTLFLKAVILLMGIAVFSLCLFVLPQGITNPNAGGYRLIFLGMYIPAVPFFLALYHGLKLLHYIDQKKAFSYSSIKSLQIIKYCAIAISILYAISLPFIFQVAEQDDAPGVVLIGLIFTGAPMLAAIIAANMQKLLVYATHLKADHDLTV